MSGGLNGLNLMFHKHSHDKHLKALKKDLKINNESKKSSVQNINMNTTKLDLKLALAPDIQNNKWTLLSFKQKQ